MDLTDDERVELLSITSGVRTQRLMRALLIMHPTPVWADDLIRVAYPDYRPVKPRECLRQLFLIQNRRLEPLGFEIAWKGPRGGREYYIKRKVYDEVYFA